METDPDNGTLIADFEGATNLSVLVCKAFSHNQQTPTVWSMRNFTSDKLLPLPQTLAVDDGLYNSALAVLNLTPDLDGVVLYCGTKERPKLAHFQLRIYSKFHM